MPAPTPGTYVNGAAGPATSASVSAPGGRVVGQPLTAHLYVYNPSYSIPTPSGWDLINQTAASSFQIVSYWRRITGDAGDNFAASGWASTYCHAGMLPFTGASTTRPIDAIGDDGAGSSGVPSARGLTTSLADCQLVWCMSGDSPATIRVPAGFVEHDRGLGVLLATMEQAVAGPSGDQAGTMTPSQPWAAHLFAVSPAGVVVPVAPRKLLLGVGV